MLNVAVENDTLKFGPWFALSFQRTLRIPDSDSIYPLPPGLGNFPIYRVEDFRDRVPDIWNQHGGVFIPMYQREAMWICFHPVFWRSNAVKIAAGKINAVSGGSWNDNLSITPQDYIVCPGQHWLDGFNVGSGFIRQFVAMPLGMGYTIEGQFSGKEEFGGLQIIVFEPKPGKFPDEAPPLESLRQVTPSAMNEGAVMPGLEMGLGAGGKMRQKIYPDPFSHDTWDETNFGHVYVHIVNSLMFKEITGMNPPDTPVDAHTYTNHGYPWYGLYEEDKMDLPASIRLKEALSIQEMDELNNPGPQQNDATIDIQPDQIVELVHKSGKINDGNL